GNGVIVISTKKGIAGNTPAIDFNINFSSVAKPNFSPASMKHISSSEFIDVEIDLFEKGYYNSKLNSQYRLVSPVVSILAKIRSGDIGIAEAEDLIDEYRSKDILAEMEEHLYQTG